MSVAIKISGAKEVDAKLALAGKNAVKYTRAAIRPGARIIERQAKANAPKITGLIRRAIRTISTRVRDHTVTLLIIISPRVFAKAAKKPYGIWQEAGHFLGHKPRGSFKGPDAKSKYHAASLATGRKWIEGKHFLQNAYDSKQGEATAVITQNLQELATKDLS